MKRYLAVARNCAHAALAAMDQRQEHIMKSHALGLVVAAAVVLAGVGVSGQFGDAVDQHVVAARAAAGPYHPALFSSLCSEANIRPPATAPQRGQRAAGPGGAAAGPPDRSTWHAEPVKVFDNL